MTCCTKAWTWRICPYHRIDSLSRKPRRVRRSCERLLHQLYPLAALTTEWMKGCRMSLVGNWPISLPLLPSLLTSSLLVIDRGLFGCSRYPFLILGKATPLESKSASSRPILFSDFDHRLPSAQDGFGFGDSPFERRENTIGTEPSKSFFSW